MASEKKWTEAGILRLIEDRYEAPRFATFTHVRDSTGWNAKRTLDAVTMGLWPSSGLEIHGFEVKVTRGDWRRELKQPEKMEDVADHLDRFYIVAPPGVVLPAEVPEMWGWLEARLVKGRYRLHAKKKAKGLAKVGQTVDRAFVASLLRKLSESEDRRLKGYVHESAIENRILDACDVAVRNDGGNFQVEKRAHDQLKERVRIFEEVSGVSMPTWNGDVRVRAKALERVMQLHQMGASAEKAIRDYLQACDAMANVAQTMKHLVGEDFLPVLTVVPTECVGKCDGSCGGDCDALDES